MEMVDSCRLAGLVWSLEQQGVFMGLSVLIQLLQLVGINFWWHFFTYNINISLFYLYLFTKQTLLINNDLFFINL